MVGEVDVVAAGSAAKVPIPGLRETHYPGITPTSPVGESADLTVIVPSGTTGSRVIMPIPKVGALPCLTNPVRWCLIILLH